MRAEWWAVDYTLGSEDEKAPRAKVFESESAAQDFIRFPPPDVKIRSKAWNLMERR